MRQLVYLLLTLLLLREPVAAQSLSDSDTSAFRDIITRQIDAFRADDGSTAYSFAAPMIQRIFPNPDVFMNMVRNQYPPVYRPKTFEFGAAGFSASGRPIQRVTILGPDGLTYEAIYTMEQQPDGTWEINGCALVRVPDLGA